MKADRPVYPRLINPTTLRIFLSILTRGQRSLRMDARRMVGGLRPPLLVRGSPPSIGAHGTLVAVNHYHRPGFDAWWIALAIAAQFPSEMHWALTAAWTYPDALRSATLTPLTRWFFLRLAGTYGLTNMPPLAARGGDVRARARAVRQMLAYVRTADKPLIGLAPEGRDSPTGGLIRPPTGTGRFIGLLGAENLQMQAAGLYETGGRLRLCFGEPKGIPQPSGLSAHRDQEISEWVMRGIAGCLPPELRGEYA
jgi:hypothetical protein